MNEWKHLSSQEDGDLFFFLFEETLTQESSFLKLWFWGYVEIIYLTSLWTQVLHMSGY